MVRTQLEEVFAVADQGRFLDATSEALAEVARSVDKSGKPGKLTITFTVKSAERGQVFITPAVTTKEPAAPVMDSLFFVSEDGLSRTDPFQKELPMSATQLRITEGK